MTRCWVAPVARIGVDASLDLRLLPGDAPGPRRVIARSAQPTVAIQVREHLPLHGHGRSGGAAVPMPRGGVAVEMRSSPPGLPRPLRGLAMTRRWVVPVARVGVDASLDLRRLPGDTPRIASSRGRRSRPWRSRFVRTGRYTAMVVQVMRPLSRGIGTAGAVTPWASHPAVAETAGLPPAWRGRRTTARHRRS